jgi:hypothetical protein
MNNKSLNSYLRKASVAKKDDFYTQLTDIEKELKNYKKYFKNKIVYCNCDDPRVSNFFHYFSYNFEKLQLKKLITTCYQNKERDLFSLNDSKEAIYLEYEGDKNKNYIPDVNEIEVKKLNGDGDFRSEECINLLKKSDIVVTNPPFSLFREYVSQLFEYKKKFIILGHQNAIAYKEIFKFIKSNELKLGFDNGGTKWFGVNENYQIKTESRKKIIDGKKYFSMGNLVWFTNLNIVKKNNNLILYKKFNKSEYPKFDNYNAINVNKTIDIPLDYKGKIGVPITFLNKYNPNEFEIIDGLNRHSILEGPTAKSKGKYLAQVNGKPVYIRIVIKRKV